MQILAGILGCMAVILMGLLLREVRKRKQAERRYDEQDRILTGYVAEHLDMEKTLSEMKYDYEQQQEMSEEIQRMQEQCRLLKHDMKNHTLVILAYLDEGKTDEIRQYAGEILDKVNRMYTYIHVGNSLLSYIINSKLSKAKELGVEIKAEIENLPFDYMDSVDFSALIGNMLDNAICGALNSKEKKLQVDISSQKGFDVITVKNSIDGSVLEKNPTLISSKDEPGHGYGIKQIRTITEKYNGTLKIYEKNEMFIISIMLG